MPYFRQSYLASRATLDDAGTKTYDINIQDPITSFFIEFRCANGATSNINNPLAPCVTEVEVIDGSEVLWSLDGQELVANSAYKTGKLGYQLVEEQGGNTQNCLGMINFGRWHGDRQFAFDPKRYRNPQVRVKWDLEAVNSVAATAYLTGGMRFTCVANIMEGAPSPQAFLQTKELYTWTTAASGDVSIDLPVDYPYVSLMVCARKAAATTGDCVSQLELHGDERKIVFFDMRTYDLLRECTTRWGRFHYDHRFLVSDNTTIYFILKQEEAAQFQCNNLDDVVFRYVNVGYGEGKLYMDSAGSAETTDRIVDASVSGYSPWGFIYIPFGRIEEPDSWLPVSLVKSLKLIATDASASATGYIVATQARSY